MARSLSAAHADRDFLTGRHPDHGHHLTHFDGDAMREEPAGGSRNYAGSDTLTEIEIQALIFAKRRIKTSVELVPDGIPSIETAVRWIADLGGWAGHYTKYKPGSTTIARGLVELARYTTVFTALTESPELLKRLSKKR